LFGEVNKLPLLAVIVSIFVIFFQTEDGIRDIMSILKRRYPAGNIIVYPVPVQGDGAAEQITAMLRTAEKRNECDVIIISRGGGSIEDLRAFKNVNPGSNHF